MFLCDRTSSQSVGPFSTVKEIQPRLKLPTNRVEDALTRKLRYRIELRHLNKNPRGRERGQPVRNSAKSPGRFDDPIVVDGAGASFHPRIIGNLEELGQHAHRFLVCLQNLTL